MEKTELNILTPPNSMVSGSDVLSRKTERYLQKNGIHCKITDLWPDYWARKLWISNMPFGGRLFKYTFAKNSCNKILNLLERGSVVWILESALPFDQKCSFEKKILQKNCAYIYHMKDDVFSMADKTQAEMARIRIPLADLVIVPTSCLRDRVKDLFPHAQACVFEEPVDVDRLFMVHEKQSYNLNNPIVTWAGSAANQRQLYNVLSVLEKVYEEKPFFFRIISGAKNPNLQLRIPWEWVPYSYENEAQLFNGSTIALAPLKDEPVAHCKGAYKIKVYMACGIASIVSPVGYQNELISHGNTGLFANSKKDWSDALLMLLKNIDLAVEMGNKARLDVVDRFSYKKLMPIWAENLKRTFPQL